MSKSETKISSVTELAKYSIGNQPYMLFMKPIGLSNITINNEDAWAFGDEVHPKVKFDWKILKGVWPYKCKTPRLPDCEFDTIVSLLSSDLVVGTFEISIVERCTYTGEFVYADPTGMWMPESCLFDTIAAARRERTRIMRLIVRWAQRNPVDLT